MKYFIIAGEASGDLHASGLMRGLQGADPEASFRYLGGDRMQAVADGILFHYRETNYMLLDILLHLGKILRRIAQVKREIVRFGPDAVILVDYPGFNLRIAGFARREGFRVFYYISPKVWAWKQKRVKLLKKYTDRMFVIFPFEVGYFARFDVPAEFYGNPLMDTIHAFEMGSGGQESFNEKNNLSGQPVIALLPGSRKKEIEHMLPVMIRVADSLPGFQYVIAAAPSIEPEFYRSFYTNEGIRIVYDQTYPLLETAVAGLITSGTATLETALLGVPMVVLYKTNSFAYQVGKRLINTNFISLVNLIAGKQVVLEVIQKDMERVSGEELRRIVSDEDYRRNMLGELLSLRSQLGEPGVAQRIAGRIVELINE